jgi:hypothetical protein
MQVELDKVSLLLDAAAKSFGKHVDEDGCSRLSEAAAILEHIISKQTQPAVIAERPRTRSAVA